ncbi:MAG: hypothetical protein QW103_01375 [Candidatus Pacearchaeota archaeon]
MEKLEKRLFDNELFLIDEKNFIEKNLFESYESLNKKNKEANEKENKENPYQTYFPFIPEQLYLKF